MKFKNEMRVILLLLFVLMIGTVNATENITDESSSFEMADDSISYTENNLGDVEKNNANNIYASLDINDDKISQKEDTVAKEATVDTLDINNDNSNNKVGNNTKNSKNILGSTYTKNDLDFEINVFDKVYSRASLYCNWELKMAVNNEIFTGYMKIFRGDSCIFTKYISGYGGSCSWDSETAPAGEYTVKIINDDGTELISKPFTIYKAKSRVDYIQIGGYALHNLPSNGFKAGTKQYFSFDAIETGTGNNLKQGTAKIILNGKTYKIKINSEGVANIKIKLPSKPKKYKCIIKLIGTKNYYGSSKTLNLRIKSKKTAKKVVKSQTKKRSEQKLFTVKIPLWVNIYSIKKIGKYKIKIKKDQHLTQNHERYSGYRLKCYVNGKPMNENKYKVKIWFHINSYGWIFAGINNYGSITSNKLTYYQYSTMDKAKISMWKRS